MEQIVIGYQDGIGGFGRVVLEITPGSKFGGEISHHFPTCVALNDHLAEVYLEAGVDGNLEILDEGVLGQAFVMEGGRTTVTVLMSLSVVTAHLYLPKNRRLDRNSVSAST